MSQESSILERIQAVAAQLAALRHELASPDADPQTGLAVPKISSEGVRMLKLEVDQMRLFLWAFMESWSLGGNDARHRLQRMRMEAAAEMLRQIQNDARIAGLPGTAEAQHLSDALRSISPMMPE